MNHSHSFEGTTLIVLKIQLEGATVANSIKNSSSSITLMELTKYLLYSKSYCTLFTLCLRHYSLR